MDRMNVSYSDAEGTVVLSNENNYIRIQLVGYYKQLFGHGMGTCNIIVKQSEDKRFWDNTTKVVGEFTFSISFCFPQQSVVSTSSVSFSTEIRPHTLIPVYGLITFSSKNA